LIIGMLKKNNAGIAGIIFIEKLKSI